MGKRIKEVTQITSKTTAVAIDGYDGIIKTVPLAENSGALFQFTVNNPKVREISTVLISTEYSNKTGFSSRELTLTGTSGTANVIVNGVNYLATFTTDLETSAVNFVSSHAAALLALGITVTEDTGVLSFSALTVSFPTISIANVSGNLSGTLAATVEGNSTGDVLATLVSFTKGSFVVRIKNIASAGNQLNTFAKIHFKVTHN